MVPVRRFESVLSVFAVFALLATLLPGLAGPGFAADFPERVELETSILDREGQPLTGVEDLRLLYSAADGEALFAEAVDGVPIVGGRLRVVLGSGRPLPVASWRSLGQVLARHPEVLVEITVGGSRYAPRIGILPAGHTLESRLVAAGLRTPDDGGAHWKHYQAPGGATAVQTAVLSPEGAMVGAVKPDSATFRSRPYALPVVGPGTSPPVAELPRAVARPLQVKEREINPPRHESLFDAQGNRFGSVAPRRDDPLAAAATASGLTPAPNFQFEGIGNINGVLPPDTEGAVGPNHYVQVVNLSFAIYDKAGVLLTGPTNTSSLWAGFGGPCQSFNDGDAIFLYDEAADRFVLTQFAVSSGAQSVCWAVSQTSDPTGAYYLYETVTPRFPDYYKVGVWPDPDNNAYFFGTNSGYQGQYDVFAVDRARMLTGAAARPMQFFQNFVNLMMPADLDGYNAGGPGQGAPPSGSPGLFYTFRDGGESYFGSPSSDSLDLWEFDVDWATAANSTFTLVESLTPAQGLANFNWTVCGFFVSDCIPQPGTGQGIDSASWWPMQRLVYRNFGTHETLVGSWTVDVLAVGNRAAPRWFELRDGGGGWAIHQQGTHSPDAIHRWMPSIAMDGSGNIALGYSRGDGSNFPSIYYTVREATDALGTLQTEAELISGTGSQTHSAARWGDYSSMELDPADDCTFWYTTEYLTTSGSAPWRTRVGNFTIPGCGGPPVPAFNIACAPGSHAIQQGGSSNATCTVTSVNGYAGTVGLSCSGTPAGVSCAFTPAAVTPPVDGSDVSSLTITVDGAQPTGSFLFDVVGDDGASTRTSPLSVDVIPAGSNGPQEASYDPTYLAPSCLVPGSSCDSLNLLDGRDGKGPEPNQPNTINNSCADGTSGTYHNDESNDRIVVSTLDGGNFTEGDTVEIAATVWAWSTGSADTLDLYYAADASAPSWSYIGSIVPPGGGSRTLTAQYTLPTGALQAVRARFRYQGSPSPCAVGSWDDHDDLVFAVEPPGGGCTVDADCDDGLFCNGAETCDTGTGSCESGPPPTCDDDLYCNGAESCNESTDSCDAGTPPVCDNGQFCDGAESCNESTDSCDAGTSPACDNGQFCDGAESCNESTDSCDPGSPPCDPGTETCDESGDVCEPIGCASDAECDDGLFCNGAETCDLGSGICQGGAPPACDDGQFCNGTESCDEGTDSCDAGTPVVCDNGLYCDGVESCNEGTDSCDAGTPVVCENGLYCDGVEVCNEGTDSCDAGSPPACDDGQFCNGVESCNEGNDSCDAGSPVICDNGLYCDGAEVCNEGTDSCDSGTPPVCDDGQFCNGAESCNEASDSCDPGAPVTCDNGQFCDGVEVCNEGTDSCDAGTPPVCDDGLFCNGAESCNEASDSCDAGAPPVCDDGVGCTVDSCNESTDSCDAAPDDAACDNGAFCDGNEVCDPMADCQPGAPPCSPGQTCDEGADLCEGLGAPVIWFSFDKSLSVPGVGNVGEEDVISYDELTGQWEMVFDGSDVGLDGFKINALARLPNGDLLLSFKDRETVDGQSVEVSDILRFSGTLGVNTAGSFSWYFDGSDVGLSRKDEGIDGIALAPDGRLILSVTGKLNANGASGQDEDLFLFTGSVGSANTSGSFSLYFDGSDVDLTKGGEDLDGITLSAAGSLLFSTTGDVSVPGVKAKDEDVVEFSGTFGDPTSGSFSLRLDLSSLGIDKDVVALQIVE